MNQPSFKEVLLRWRRKIAVRCGNPKYCRTGEWERIERVFEGRRNGIFFEAGAHDGWTGSNTYWLEASLGWQGILVEPVPGLTAACRVERTGSQVYHAALVSDQYSGSTVDVECSGLVSAVVSSPMVNETRVIARAYYKTEERPTVTVPALTMNACLERAGVDRLDFVSLDVEGFEGEALRGLDLERWRPDWMLIEANDFDDVYGVVRDWYVVAELIGARDVLFKRRALIRTQTYH